MGFGAGFLLASLERHIHKTTIWVGGRIFRFKTFEKALGNFIFLKKKQKQKLFFFSGGEQTFLKNAINCTEGKKGEAGFRCFGR